MLKPIKPPQSSQESGLSTLTKAQQPACCQLGSGIVLVWLVYIIIKVNKIM
jgi:hypothetical protein